MIMTAPTTTTTPYRPAPARPGDDRFVPLAADLGARFAERAAEHDRDNTFVEENYTRLRESCYTALPIPEDAIPRGKRVANGRMLTWLGIRLAVPMHH